MARPKLKRPPKLRFEVNLESYLLLIRVAFLQPLIFISQIPKSRGLGKPLAFFLANASIGYLLAAILDRLTSINHPSIFFALSQLVILIPVLVVSLFVGCSVLFAIAKLLKGKGNFEQTFNIICYCSIPIIFLNLPTVGYLAFLWMLGLNIIGFKNIHQYSVISAIVNVLLPLLVLIIVGLIVGVIGSILFLNLPNFNHLDLSLKQPTIEINPPNIQTN